MKRTREIADTPEKGQKRYLLYKAVLDQYEKAKKNGYYLEAITLMESIITDRLESALIFYGAMTPDEAFLALEWAIKKLEKFSGIVSDKLLQDIIQWKNARNHALHEMAKIEDGDKSSFEQRYSDQKTVAEDGYKLFNKIKNELR